MWPDSTQLGYADSFFLLGSCFSDNISAHLSRAKLPTSLNPAHGNLYCLDTTAVVVLMVLLYVLDVDTPTTAVQQVRVGLGSGVLVVARRVMLKAGG